ncbi:uncharacterized protein L203_100017 [Cryptococcus depauperatus CBS 7841]|uniref:Uncharacterized protein n=1 Tax=Cryptococcus depauperatus CBS 7841 TaxID=1295531 RepID=A0A1E3IZX7_9TREE|nr:hypothetical protein L203_00325 [Cryptococcus depauperatus CBS 7841]
MLSDVYCRFRGVMGCGQLSEAEASAAVVSKEQEARWLGWKEEQAQDVGLDPSLPSEAGSRDTIDAIDTRQGHKMRAVLPNGQQLPDWMSLTTYVTEQGGIPITTASIVELPLTYYGPSIPLGPGWSYGGSVPPHSTTSKTTASSTARTRLTASRSATLSSSTESLQTSTSSPTSSNSRSSTSMLPLLSSSSKSVSTPTFSSSSTHALPTSSTLSTGTVVPSTTASLANLSTHHNLLAPLLAVLVPIGIALLILFIILCFYRRRRLDKDVGLFPWLFKPSQWVPVPAGPAVPSQKKPLSNKSKTSSHGIGGLKSPDERSALLPDFVAQHHRNSSSISGVNVSADNDEEMRNLVRQNQSLLQRLTVGLGWATPNSLHRSDVSSRRTSNGTAEKGMDTGRRILSGAMAAAEAAAVSLKRNSRSTTQPTSGTGSSVHRGEYERVLDDDQLFYKVPTETQSSRESAADTNTTSSSKQSKGSRWVNTQPILPEEVASHHESRPSMTFSVTVPETPGSKNLSEKDMDVVEFGKKTTMGGNKSMQKEKMKFPMPPGLEIYKHRNIGQELPNRASTSDDKISKKESRTSSESWHSAQSEQSAGYQAAPPPGSPLRRNELDYKHASLSVFGSVPATPTGTSFEHGNVSTSPHSALSHALKEPSPQKPIHPPSVFSTPERNPFPHRHQTSSKADDTINPIKRMFSRTPQSSTGSKSRVEHDSYHGQPLIDEASLKEGGGGVVPRGKRSVGEFGETLKRSQSVTASPVIVSPSQASLAHSSESASIYTSNLGSTLSQSRSGSSNGGGVTNTFREVKEAMKGDAVRGMRSQAEFIRASRIGVSFGEVPPLPSSETHSTGSSKQKAHDKT